MMNKLCLSSNIDGIPEVYPSSSKELLIKMNQNLESREIVRFENYQFINELNKFDKYYYPDIEDCAKKLIVLINNPKLCQSLLEKHKRFIRKNFSIEKHFSELNKILGNYLIC